MAKFVLKWPKFLLFGDSLTQYSYDASGCWGSLVASMLQRKCDVVARGFAGYNSHMCSAVLPVVMGEFDPSMIVGVTIFLGANDANFKDLNPIQHVSLTEYTENLRHMVLFLESQGVSRKKVTLIGPPAFNGAEWAKELECRGLGMPLSKDNEITGIYAQACESLANELNCDCVNLWKAMMDCSEEEWKAMLCDGLHLSQKGSQFLFNLLQPMIEERTNTLPLILPEWKDMKESSPQQLIFQWIQRNA